ncbi:hydrogenase maturation factor [Candidatus Vecturithrix granuli]|uniref:Hydrogenase maturation factor n=1 Tax=Vecturithrix granuli TaxID=1499967 RepID=A0A081C4E5_VECG1|nr:hydrogenase maturation factor [Candidatus Vecturithrix granuli]
MQHETKPLPVGKLKLEQLQELLQKYTTCDERVVVGARVGEDAAVIDFGETYLVAKTDPITFVTDDIGWYTIVVNANDIVTRGATPKWFLATILLPEHQTTEYLVDAIFAQLAAACRRYHIVLCGGHTEVTYGLDRPIVIGQMLGEVRKDQLIQTSGARVGDDILLTKGIAIEATSIIASVKSQVLQHKYSVGFLHTCRQFIYTPGISVIEDAMAALESGHVSAMHDPTEGGLATGLHELAEAAGIGLRIQYEAIPIFPETRTLCAEYELDPLGAIASGALIVTAAPQETGRLLTGFQQKGIQASVIGKATSAKEGRILVKTRRELPLPIYHQDEITQIFV